ncbi:hypothetical protein M514_06117 [Trichuris suis]|uniref:Uncharacterized protein n=1 Tax=Trichuris suis TaxID=68888 RepID=A0A085NK71_9BILA|nr:hypothetical protein M513_06117 [Trichuris suis]KFD69867.1 hypothetical protein M514_06117 [Trichuris suis]
MSLPTTEKIIVSHRLRSTENIANKYLLRSGLAVEGDDSVPYHRSGRSNPNCIPTSDRLRDAVGGINRLHHTGLWQPTADPTSAGQRRKKKNS